MSYTSQFPLLDASTALLVIGFIGFILSAVWQNVFGAKVAFSILLLGLGVLMFSAMR